MKLIVDADSIPYSVGYAAKGEPLNYVLNTVKNAINKMKEEAGCEEASLYIKGEGNFREDIAISKGYKSHRKSEKPPFFTEMLEYMRDVHGAIPVDGMEADDMVSYLLYQDYVKAGGDKELTTLVLSSADKDLNNTPGWHHNPRTGEVTWVSDLQADRHFLYQMLAGDTADNIKGLPSLPPHVISKFGLTKAALKGVGAATAKKLMQVYRDVSNTERLVWECYLEWGKDKDLYPDEVLEYFTEQAQLLWMIRDMKDGEPVMYEPNIAAFEEAVDRVYTPEPEESLSVRPA